MLNWRGISDPAASLVSPPPPNPVNCIIFYCANFIRGINNIKGIVITKGVNSFVSTQNVCSPFNRFQILFKKIKAFGKISKLHCFNLSFKNLKCKIDSAFYYSKT